MFRLDRQFDALFRDDKESGAERLIMLSDGIFAIAMTLLVLDLKLPDNLPIVHGSIPPASFQGALIRLFLQTFFYGLTFLVIANYWRSHRRLMHLVERVNTRFIQLTLLF